MKTFKCFVITNSYFVAESLSAFMLRNSVQPFLTWSKYDNCCIKVLLIPEHFQSAFVSYYYMNTFVMLNVDKYVVICTFSPKTMGNWGVNLPLAAYIVNDPIAFNCVNSNSLKYECSIFCILEFISEFFNVRKFLCLRQSCHQRISKCSRSE